MANTIHDITFVVALAFDSKYREKNFKLHKQHWKKLGVKVVYEIVTYNENKPFHRTNLLNKGLEKVQTKYAAITDVDCVFDLDVLQNALNVVDNKTFVIPFDKVKHIDTESNILFEWNKGPHLDKQTLDKHFYTGNFDTFIDYNKLQLPSFTAPTGLCGIVDIETYRRCGFENENSIDYAFEDIERIVRMDKLGVKTKWMNATGTHLWHPSNSRSRNKLFRNNFFEYLKICDMSKEELQSYIDTWN